MKNTLLISHSEAQTRFALLKNGNPVELRLEHETCIGDIFAGYVQTINKALGMAFIDLGGKIPGLLPLSQSFWTKPPFHEGQKILVQVTRDADSSSALEKTKGVRLSHDISFSTPFFIYLPKSPGLKFSRTLPKDSVNPERLSALKESLAHGEGLIIRRLVDSVSLDVLQNVVHTCQKTWSDLQEHFHSFKKPSLLLKGPSFSIQYILHHVGSLEKIITNDKNLFHAIKSFFATYGLSSVISLESHISLHQDSLFKDYHIEDTWDILEEPVIKIPDVGELILDKTTAFWVFDVNASSTSLSPFDINLKAGEKILEEIRLKNLSGTIVVDFIPLRSLPLRQKLLTLLQKQAHQDPNQTHVHSISPLGLCEITRTKKGPSLLEDRLY